MSDYEQHTSHRINFRVENFKCFDDFQVNNLGLFNIITGDNNIGKTSLLEALCLDESIFDVFSVLLYFLKNRDFDFDEETEAENIFEYYTANRKLKITNSFADGGKDTIEIYYKKATELNSLERTIVDQSLSGNKKQYLSEGYFLIVSQDELQWAIAGEAFVKADNTYPIVLSKNLYSSDLNEIFTDEIQKTKYREQIEKYLKIFIPDLLRIEPTSFKPSSYYALAAVIPSGDNGKVIYNPLSGYGDGFTKFVRYLFQIVSERGRYLLVDEIDAGVYYKRLKSYWMSILQIAYENNVQLFVTTHSKECLDYLVEAMEELGEEYQKKLRYINMYRNNEGKPASTTYSYNSFKTLLESGNEMR